MTDNLSEFAPDLFAAVLALTSVALDPKATAERLKALDAKIAASKKAEAAAEGAKVAQDQRSAQLDLREQKIAADEEKVLNWKIEVDEKYAAIGKAWSDIDTQKTKLKGQMMAFANWTRHPLQSEPSIESLELEIYGGNRDAHFANEVETPVFGTERVEHAPAIATIRRTRRADRQ
jgi:hypothetical protein